MFSDRRLTRQVRDEKRRGGGLNNGQTVVIIEVVTRRGDAEVVWERDL